MVAVQYRLLPVEDQGCKFIIPGSAWWKSLSYLTAACLLWELWSWLLSRVPTLLFGITFKGETFKVRLFHCTKPCSCGVRLCMPQDGQPLFWPHFLHLPNSFLSITQPKEQPVAGQWNLAVLITTAFHSTLLKQGHADNGYFISVLCAYWAIYFPTYVSELEIIIHF